MLLHITVAADPLLLDPLSSPGPPYEFSRFTAMFGRRHSGVRTDFVSCTE